MLELVYRKFFGMLSGPVILGLFHLRSRGGQKGKFCRPPHIFIFFRPMFTTYFCFTPSLIYFPRTPSPHIICMKPLPLDIFYWWGGLPNIFFSQTSLPSDIFIFGFNSTKSPSGTQMPEYPVYQGH